MSSVEQNGIPEVASDEDLIEPEEQTSDDVPLFTTNKDGEEVVNLEHKQAYEVLNQNAFDRGLGGLP